MAFAHLHVHTEYSLLDGSNKIKEYVKRVKELGMTAAAITDHGAMYGVIDFYRAARAEGINPILGCEVYVAPNSRFDREITGGDDRYYHLVLLAENNTGYANLSKIVSRGFTEGYYYKPRVDMEVLEEFHEGIIALSACLAGEVPRYIQKGLPEEAKKCALKYQSIFGKDNYFLELQDHGIPEQQTVNMALLTDVARTGHSVSMHERRALHLCGGRKAPRYPSVYPDRQKAFRRKPDALRGRSVFRQKRRRDEGTVSLCVGGSGKYTARLQTAVMWKSSLVRRSCRILMCRRAMIPGDI